MDTFESALMLVKPNMYFASTNICRGYYSTPIAKEDQIKLIIFMYLGNLYQYKALPEGISCAPNSSLNLRSQSMLLCACLDIKSLVILMILF